MAYQYGKHDYPGGGSSAAKYGPSSFHEQYSSFVTKGEALIIVNKTFPNQDDRQAVNHDYIGKLQNLLDGAGVTHQYHENLTAKEITALIKTFETDRLLHGNSLLQDFSSSLLFVVLVSHGSCGRILGVDGQVVFIETLVDALGRREEIRDIPKIFIAQCCQDFWTPDSFNQDAFQKKLIPVTCPNVHVEYTTLPGCKDLDWISRGSVYFDTWLQVMVKYGHLLTLQEIFQHTKKKLGEAEPIPYGDQLVKMCPLSFSSLHTGIFLKPMYRDRHSLEGPYLRVAMQDEEECVVLGPLSDVETLPYFHPAVSDSKEVKQALEDYRGQRGSFLLRSSFSTQGKYVFCVVGLNRSIIYMTLEVRERKGRFSFSMADKTFSSVPELVQHYQSTHIPTMDNRTDLFLSQSVCPVGP